MAKYSYYCGDDGTAEVTLPIGTAPATICCPQCRQPAKRMYHPPLISEVDRSRMNLIDTAAASADRPEVVTSVPPGGRVNRMRTPMAPPDPRLQKLPRP